MSAHLQSSKNAHFSEFLLRGGGGPIAIDQNDLGSEVEYWRSCPAIGVKLIDKIIIHITDGDIGSGAYGENLLLVNGLTLKHVEADGVTVVHNLTPLPVLTNEQWGRYTNDMLLIQLGPGMSAESSLVIKLTFADQPIALQPLERMVLAVHDDFSELGAHTTLLQGRYSEAGFS